MIEQLCFHLLGISIYIKSAILWKHIHPAVQNMDLLMI